MAVPKKKKNNSNTFIKSSFFNIYNNKNLNLNNNIKNQIDNIYFKKLNSQIFNYFKRR